MKTLGEVLALSHQFLEKARVARSRRMAEELLSGVLGLKRIDLYTSFERPLLEDELDRLRFLLKRAANHEPVSYLLGEVDFYGCEIGVDRSVLIPRPETELLVEKGINELETNAGISVLDLCCGSGCIGVAVKKKCPNWKVCASDLSQEALAVAKSNSERAGVEIDFTNGDLLEPWQGRRFSAIFCNPPYVSEGEYRELEDSVRNFEPKLALVGGERGTEIYESLEKQLPAYLEKGGKVFFEIGADQGPALCEIFSSTHWKRKRIEKDWSGRDRFFFLEIE